MNCTYLYLIHEKYYTFKLNACVLPLDPANIDQYLLFKNNFIITVSNTETFD